MPSELANKLSAIHNEAKALWDDKVTDEIKTIFKKNYEAFINDDNASLIADGFPRFYARMELGKDIAPEFKPGATPGISPDGNIDSDGKYEKYDLGWEEAGLVFIKNLLDLKYVDLTLPAQAADYAPLIIPDDAKIGLIGDWGTGDWQGNNTPAYQVSAALTSKVNPEVVVHVGDVYYYGAENQYKDNFLNDFPSGSLASFNLNSNHDMYSVAVPYFNAVPTSPFGKQGNTSYFAMTNSNWIIVGLDTAYLSSVEDAFLYGSLGKVDMFSHDLIHNEQTKFLTKMVDQAVTDNKQLVIMTHHTGYSGAGMANKVPVLPFSHKTLWHQVKKLLAPYLANNTAYWYWGHAHSGYTLNEIDNIRSRCVGHGAVPWGKGSDFFIGKGSNIEWFEQTPMPSTPPQTMNGFMSVHLKDAAIKEKYYTQDGDVTYTAINGVMQK